MIIGTKRQVWNGTANRTSGGMTRNMLERNPAGRIVSKARRLAALRNPKLQKWRMALAVTRKDINLKGFHLIEKGSPYYRVASKYYRICNLSRKNL